MIMKNRIISVILTVLTVLSIASITAFAAGPDQWGYNTEKTVTVPPVGRNKELCSLKKVYPNEVKSCIRVYSSGSTVNKMNVWVKNSSGTDFSEKYTVYPNNKDCYIYYYANMTIPAGSNVVFAGEQYNVLSKDAHFKAWSY